MDNKEQRTYQRSNDFRCITNISKDNRLWEEVDVFDLSSGGLKFYSINKYHQDETIILDIIIRGLLTEFHTKVSGTVIRIEQDGYTYAVAFQKVKPEVAVRIDEAVKRFRPKDVLE